MRGATIVVRIRFAVYMCMCVNGVLKIILSSHSSLRYTYFSTVKKGFIECIRIYRSFKFMKFKVKKVDMHVSFKISKLWLFLLLK